MGMDHRSQCQHVATIPPVTLIFSTDDSGRRVCWLDRPCIFSPSFRQVNHPQEPHLFSDQPLCIDHPLETLMRQFYYTFLKFCRDNHLRSLQQKSTSSKLLKSPHCVCVYSSVVFISVALSQILNHHL